MNKEILGINLLEIVKGEICRSRHPRARRLPTFYPSSASIQLPDGRVEGGCWRSDFYRIKGVEVTNPPEFYLSMIHKLGKAVENTVVEAMLQAGVFESAGVKFYDPVINVSGELDIVGRFRRNGLMRYFGVEVKSVYGNGATETITGRSRAYKGQAAFRPRPKTQNLLQVMTYLDQFSQEKGPNFYLEGFKLLYIPRDKPVDGREYTVFLVRKTDLTAEQLAEFGPLMKDNERYAFISTPDYPDYIETGFSLEDMYSRWNKQLEMMKNDIAPERPYKKVYSKEEVEYLYSIDELSKTAYEDWQKGKSKPGHYLCQTYCEFRDFCYKRDGSPRKEADELARGVLNENT